MYVQILCGLVIYEVVNRIFDHLDVLDLEASYSNAIFSVANRLEKLYGGKAYVGLRIPDPDTGSRQNIDIVLVTKGGAMVASVKDLSGFVTVNGDGSWVCQGEGRHKAGRHPDPVAEAKKKASVLESYLEQRGVALPEGYFSYKVIIPNPILRTIHSSCFPPEVITYEQWTELKPEYKNVLSGWIKGAFRGGEKDMQESIHQRLTFILSTAPIQDRLELEGNKYVLGEFLEFKGEQEDTQALRSIKRSKVGCMIFRKMSMFGLGNWLLLLLIGVMIAWDFLVSGNWLLLLLIGVMIAWGFLVSAPSRLQVLYCPRDYRSVGAPGSSEWKKVTVGPSTEVLFKPENSTKVRKFMLSSIVSMQLSA